MKHMQLFIILAEFGPETGDFTCYLQTEFDLIPATSSFQ